MYRYPYFKEMQWYLYDHYNIALTGRSYMTTIDGKVMKTPGSYFSPSTTSLIMYFV